MYICETSVEIGTSGCIQILNCKLYSTPNRMKNGFVLSIPLDLVSEVSECCCILFVFVSINHLHELQLWLSSKKGITFPVTCITFRIER